MTKVHVVGIGLDGVAGLSDKVKGIVEQAKLLVGSDRHLSYFPRHPAPRLFIRDITIAIENISEYLTSGTEGIVIIVSGDPLFFGLGRLLLTKLSPELLTFHPHSSSIQLAFSRIKVPWQDSRIISVHGRSLEELVKALQTGVEKIAVLTDDTNNPQAIAALIKSLNLPSQYQLWVCENLGGDDECVRHFTTTEIEKSPGFAPLNVVILLRQEQQNVLDIKTLPHFGIPDNLFLSFSDRPGLMTKREVRILVLAELALHPGQVIWDIGAGTGSVSIEIARLFPSSTVYAIEKTTAGHCLISRNCQRFQVGNIIPIQGNAPEILQQLPEGCDRIFIGGSGGNLTAILDCCTQKLNSTGVIVLALATLEHLNTALFWFKSHNWEHQLLQVQLSRSVPIGSLTRFAPLNPVTIITATRPN
ncbi:MAG: precorrin-6y C5,15-methyltransferase (decarboxylating) subunit CbiE [Nostocaceae cyanobacterium]|nr:precorrin-6y C5,15-methyltransferase (decarboxylating) subunit CbiE [Nostocaceae cyanobacterium]